jgi:hypothetical protein
VVTLSQLSSVIGDEAMLRLRALALLFLWSALPRPSSPVLSILPHFILVQHWSAELAEGTDLLHVLGFCVVPCRNHCGFQALQAEGCDFYFAFMLF